MKLRDALERTLEKYELPLYAALFLAALLIRLSALEGAPLSEQEAMEAWGALHLLRGGAAASASALFASLTAGLLFIAGPSHWAPRLFPAVAGALAVLLPLLLRSARGRIESFLVALLFALSPSLWIASTMAGGTTLGFLAAGFCLFYLRSNKKQPLMSGIALGLAAASGPVGWSGLAIALIVPLVDKILQPGDPAAGTVRAEDRPPFPPPTALAGFILGLAAGSTGLFLFPRGIGSLAAGISSWLAAFFSGWPRVGDFFLLFLGYEPIALVFGAAGIFLLWKGLLSAEDRFWGTFAAVAAVWVFIRPAAFPDEALWVILPLLILGARALRLALESTLLEKRPLPIALQVGAVWTLTAFAVFNLATYASTGKWAYLVLALIGFLGGFLPGLLFSEDWRSGIGPSLIGLALAWFGIFITSQAGAGWNATHERRASANELWQSETAAADILRLHQNLVQISEWKTGVKDELAVVIEWPEESALGWELLTFGATEYTVTVDMLSTPAMLISPYVEQEGKAIAPRLTAVYRGQRFAFFERRAWSGWPPDLIGWLLYREGPVERGHMILWVREDIMIPEQGSEQ
jgi:hypothetical protein